MGWMEAREADQLAEGDKRVVALGNREVLLVRHRGQTYAMASRCPHMRAHLVKGTIQGDAIVCPRHHSAFDLATGDVKAWSPWPPGVGRVLGVISREKTLQVYETRQRNSTILVDIPE